MFTNKADALIKALQASYMAGKPTKETEVSMKTYKDLFSRGLVDDVQMQGDRLVCSLYYYRNNRVRLYIK